ncbi:MAG: hypothetical protein OXN89_22570 [Bryobacterales bacterium]|nr:hypothetical protein [Bryobacterales bacterium]
MTVFNIILPNALGVVKAGPRHRLFSWHAHSRLWAGKFVSEAQN